jgi:Papain family cysteine protease
MTVDPAEIPARTLPDRVGHEEYRRLVGDAWYQRGQECTGFALAAIVNYLTRKQLGDPDAPSVSRRMLYEMAQRYDGNMGANWRESSTLDGALRGFALTGVARDDAWPYDPNDEDGVVHGGLTLRRLLDARQRRLRSARKIAADDVGAMKAALADGHALYVSANLHSGWHRLFLRDNGARLVGGSSDARRDPVIEKLPDDELKEGHAFVVVGYDDDHEAFWVHNSWGPEWGAEGYALLPYADWLVRGRDVWVVEIEPPVRIDTASAPVAPSADETASYRDLWPHLVVLRDDGRLAADGLYEMDPDSVGPLLFLFQEATTTWTHRRLAIVVDGGYLPLAETIERQRQLRDRLMSEEIYPIFVVWETSWWADLASELDEWHDRRAESSAGPDERSVIDCSVAGLIWYELTRRSVAACEAPHGGAKLLADAIAKNRAQTPTSRRGPYDIHLVSHGAGDLLAAEFTRLLSARLTTATAVAPATPVSVFRRAYGPLFDIDRLGQLTVIALDAEAEGADRLGPLDTSFLGLIPQLHVDPGEAAGELAPMVGPVMGVAASAGSDEWFSGNRIDERVALVEIAGSRHADLVWDRRVHDALVETMHRHTSVVERPASAVEVVAADPLAGLVQGRRETRCTDPLARAEDARRETPPTDPLART